MALSGYWEEFVDTQDKGLKDVNKESELWRGLWRSEPVEEIERFVSN